MQYSCFFNGGGDDDGDDENHEYYMHTLHKILLDYEEKLKHVEKNCWRKANSSRKCQKGKMT